MSKPKQYILKLSAEGPNINCSEDEDIILKAADLPETEAERDAYCEEYAREWFFNHYNYGWHLEPVLDEGVHS